MRDDLVKRHVEQLRLTGGDLGDLCQPLADAIEALTAERDAAEHLARMRKAFIEEARDERDAAEAERDRLREALERIAGVKGPYHHPFPEGAEGYGSFVVVTAREALKGEKA